MEIASEGIPRKSVRAVLDDGDKRELAGPLKSSTDFRIGENFVHLKLMAEKMLHEQTCVKSDLQILNTKLQNSEETVRILETTVQDMNSENIMLKLKNKQDMKLWKELDSKFLATTTFCDQLSETLHLLDCQVQEAERSKIFLEEKVAAERLKFFEDTNSQLNDLLHEKEVTEDSLRQCEANNAKLQHALQELEQTLASESIRFQQLAVEKGDLQQQLANAIKTNEDYTAAIRSIKCEIQDLQNLMQVKGELELQVKDLQLVLATELKDKDNLHQRLETLILKVRDLEKINASAAVKIEDLLNEKAECNRHADEHKLAQAKVVNELKQFIVENKMDAQLIKHQLQEAIKENERLSKEIAADELRFAALEDEANELRQEYNIKVTVISQMSKDEASLRRQIMEIQGQLAGLENYSKECQRQFELQLEAKQIELSKHLQDISQRNTEEIADMSRKFDAETREATANQRLKISEVQEEYEKEKAKIATLHAEELQEKQAKLRAEQEKISSLQEEYKQEKAKIATLHAADIQVKHTELRAERAMISTVQAGYVQEKATIAALHAKELQLKDVELRAEQQKLSGKIAMMNDFQLKFEELEKAHQEEREKFQLEIEELQKSHQEREKVQLKIGELQKSHEDEREKFKLRMEELQKSHEDEREKFQLKIGELQKSHEEERETFKLEMEEIRKSHEEERENFQIKIEELQKSHQEEERENFQLKIEELQKSHQEEGEIFQLEIEELQKSHQEERENLQLEIEELQKSHQEERENFQEDYQNLLLKVTTADSSSRQEIHKIQLEHEEELSGKLHEQKAQSDRLEKDKQVQIQKLQKSLNQDIEEWKSKAFWFESKWKEAAVKTAAKEVPTEDKQTQITNDDVMTTEKVVRKDIQTPLVQPTTKDKDAVQQSKRSGKRKLDLIIKNCSPQATQSMNYLTSISLRKDIRDIQDMYKVPMQQNQISPEVLTDAAGEGFPNDKASMTKDIEPLPLRLQQKSILSPQTVDSCQKKTVTSTLYIQASGLLPMPDRPSHQKKTVARTSQLHEEARLKAGQASASPASRTHSGFLQKPQTRPDECSNQGRITVECGNKCAEKANPVSTPNQKGTRWEISMQPRSVPSDGKTTSPKRRLSGKSPKVITHEESAEGQTKKSSKKGKFFTSENFKSINKDKPLTRSLSPAITDGVETYYKGDDPYAFS